MHINFGKIPDALKREPRWVAWHGEPKPTPENPDKLNKIPINPNTGYNAKSNDPDTWGTFEDATYRRTLGIAADGRKIDGMSFMLGDGYAGGDLDNCRNPETGEIGDEAWKVIKRFNTYTEISPSGRGVKIFGKVKQSRNRGKRKGDIEVYDRRWQFTVTGNHLEGTPTTVNDITEALDELWTELFGNESKQASESTNGSDSQTGSPSDMEVFRRLQSNAKFQDLYKGNWQKYGYPSESEADCALFAEFLWATEHNVPQAIRLFEGSPYFQQKDENHKTKWERPDYREATIAKALDGLGKYDPNYQSSKQAKASNNAKQGKTNEQSTSNRSTRASQSAAPKSQGARPIPEDKRREHLLKMAKSCRKTRKLSDAETLAALQVENEKRCESSFSTADLNQILHDSKPRLNTISLDEIQKTDYPEPNWVVPDLLPEGLAILAGRQKSGKSLMALNLALEVACGGYALGNPDIPTKKGDVLYLALEDNARRIKDRAQKMMNGGQVDPESAQRLDVVTEIPRLNKGGLEMLETWLSEHPDARLVVIDVLSKIKPRGNTTSSMYDEEYGIMGGIQSLAMRYNVTVLVIHHTTKVTFEYVFDEISGTTAISGSADTLMVLKRKDEAGILHVTGRDIETQDLALRLDSKLLLWTHIGDAETATLSQTRTMILETMQEYGDRAMSIKDVADLTGLSYNVAKQRLWQMEKDGQIQNVNGKYRFPSQEEKTYPPHNSRNQHNPRNPRNRVTNGENPAGYVTENLPRNRPPPSGDMGARPSGYDGYDADDFSQNQSENGNSASGYDGYASYDFLKTVHTRCGSGMFYTDEKLIAEAQAAGLDLTVAGFSARTNLDRILRDLTDKTIDGLTLRSLGDDAWKIEGRPSSNGTHTATAKNDEPERLELLAEIRQLETELGHYHRQDIERWDVPTLREHRWKLKEQAADAKGREVFRI